VQRNFSRFAFPQTVLAMTLLLCQIGCVNRQEKLNTEQDSSPRVEPLQLTDRTFQDTIIGSSQLILVDMWAPWCRPCIRMKPKIQELAQQLTGKVIVAELNVDQNPFIKEKYQINHYPTVLIFSRGIEVKRLIGIQSPSNLLDALEAAKIVDDGIGIER
jgi:thioredoxin